ncbi:hypothetical protein FGO68_gene16557 [Halteria grandinella]|uniref:Uncharacterized protein n=1 Tax=Halteria grandinella TaxID=5974 RepID=A0A8J8NXS4_HALGN|nr:hypothetical protein FGO68_gene16557 [Halteria grandinella]
MTQIEEPSTGLSQAITGEKKVVKRGRAKSAAPKAKKETQQEKKPVKGKKGKQAEVKDAVMQNVEVPKDKRA